MRTPANNMSNEQRSQAGSGGDVVSYDQTESWFYSDIVKDHFFNPRNFLDHEPHEGEFNARGKVGSPACGDELKVWLWVDPKSERIQKFAWKTFGCGSAIAATSIISEMVTEGEGLTLASARAIKPQDVIERLGGLPPRKIHCSVLCDKALRDAVNDYYRGSEQFDKIEPEASRLVDPIAKVTDRDIEQAVLDGATTLEAVQARTKAGIGNAEILPTLEDLIRFYREKYFS